MDPVGSYRRRGSLLFARLRLCPGLPGCYLTRSRLRQVLLAVDDAILVVDSDNVVTRNISQVRACVPRRLQSGLQNKPAPPRRQGSPRNLARRSERRGWAGAGGLLRLFTGERRERYDCTATALCKNAVLSSYASSCACKRAQKADRYLCRAR